ncbi:MAG: PTS sugar transporter subunit IIB [Traorella sp.]
MIVTFRIDERLIHGQVIATWLNTLRITHLIVANDEAAGNQLQQQMLKLAVPAKVKCLIKGIKDVERILKDPRCETMRIMLIVGKPQDAIELLKNVSEINEVNLANYGSITKPDVPNKLTISPMVSLDSDDIEAVNEIIAFGKPVFTQKTPVEQKKVLKKIEKGN